MVEYQETLAKSIPLQKLFKLKMIHKFLLMGLRKYKCL